MTQVIDMKLCGCKSRAEALLPGSLSIDLGARCTDYEGGNCGRRDFAAVFFYGTAPPAVALFALGQSRAAALLGFALWVGFACGAIVAQRTSYIRNCEFFSSFRCYRM